MAELANSQYATSRPQASGLRAVEGTRKQAPDVQTEGIYGLTDLRIDEFDWSIGPTNPSIRKFVNS